MGIPTVRPAGGHAVYIDAARFLPHIPKSEFPGQALAAELYLQDGVRTCEIGSVMFKEAATMELVRMAFPRRVYTQSHFDYILEGFQDIKERARDLKGFKIKEAPPFLRHFTVKFDRF
jgi:tryptophanase